MLEGPGDVWIRPPILFGDPCCIGKLLNAAKLVADIVNLDEPQSTYNKSIWLHQRNLAAAWHLSRIRTFRLGKN